MLRSLRRFYAGGIVEIDPNDVFAPPKAQAYDVLPQQAGLLQLLRAGSLEGTHDGYFLITKPIARFPAGLNGAHGVKIIVKKGVPLPAGNPGHSMVIMEETGECVSGSRCR